MTVSPAQAYMEELAFFRCLSPQERSQLARLCRVLLKVRGETLFSEGDRPSGFSFVVLGCVKIVKAGPGRSAIVAIAGPGEPVGVVAAFESQPFPATAIALAPTTVLEVPEQPFLAAVDRHPEIVRQILRISMRRQFETARRIAEMTGPVEDRIARLLLGLAERHGRPEGSRVRLGLPLHRQDLADLAGTTVETAIRVMSRWAKERVVATEDDGFLLERLDVLRELAAGADRVTHE